MPSTCAIVVHPSAEALALAAAERLASLVAETERPPFFLALSGGATPQRLYEILAGDRFRERVAWARLEIFFADERAVPPDHLDSNFAMVARALLAHVPVKAHRMPAESGDAEAYARLVGTRVVARRDGVPVLDLVLLGIGTDGHTASLFPGTPALDETRNWVVMNEVPSLGARRMSFTYPLINASRRVWILATGGAKREIVMQCLRAPAAGEPGGAALRQRWPVVGVRPHEGELVWWLDEAAAG